MRDMDEAFFYEGIEDEIKDVDALLREYNYNNYRLSLQSLTEVLMIENSMELVTESADLDIVLEGKIIDAVKRILSNWTKNTSTVWKRFKELMLDRKTDNFITNNQRWFELKGTMNIPENFEIPHPVVVKKFATVELPQFKDDMLKDLTSKEDFITSTHIVSLFRDFIVKGKTIKEAAMEKCFTKIPVGGQKMEHTEIDNYIKFMDEAHNIIDNLTKTINSLNKSSQDFVDTAKDIEAGNIGANDIRNAQEEENARKATANESYNSLKNYYLTEADPPNNTAQPNQSNNNNSAAWKSADGGGNEQKKKSSELPKEVTTFMAVYTEILSAQMAVTNKARTNSYTILQKWVDMQKEQHGGGKKAAANNKAEESNNTEAPQVKE